MAQSRYGSRGEFFCGDASSARVRELAQDADAFLSLGVLHHLTDQQIDEILGLARACLRPSGRFIFYEPCFSANDDCVGRMFMRLDRGRNIKTDQAWRALLSEYFATVEEHIRRPVYLFRYTIKVSSPGTRASHDFPAPGQIIDEGLRLKIIIAACQRTVVHFW